MDESKLRLGKENIADSMTSRRFIIVVQNTTTIQELLMRESILYIL